MRDFVTYLIAITIANGVGLLVGYYIGSSKCDKELIERKLKHYDQETGELVWKGEKL